MKDIFRINILMDFYSDLLTLHQVKILELYASNDYSLTEIAEIVNISRQGVYDNIKRALKQLEDYEKKLKLYEKFKLNSSKLNIIIDDISNKKYENITKLVNEIVKG